MHPAASPRPIHRWQTFWWGILVLTFLFWAWHRSYRNHDEAGFTFADHAYDYLSTDATLSLFIIHPAGFGTNYEPRLPHHPIELQIIRHGTHFTAHIYHIAWWLILTIHFRLTLPESTTS
ncbi:hypothetical protein OKA04_24215 [Luteolibacter flavescens]|uniref:Uncharacterized protein n=1 Tax=Luteolibacter flavescens TaxID=1859460 RepID=A0ABT3FW91_9BACT|nr:hypothetical protein [Luteolibacter flavescens]MCW1887866.1 hypothetical protein [Luteolibacter flavescens]